MTNWLLVIIILWSVYLTKKGVIFLEHVASFEHFIILQCYFSHSTHFYNLYFSFMILFSLLKALPVLIKPIIFIFLFAVVRRMIYSPAENEVVEISPVYTQRKYIETKHLPVKMYSLSLLKNLLHEFMLPCVRMTLLSSCYTWFAPVCKKSASMSFIVNDDTFLKWSYFMIELVCTGLLETKIITQC